MSDDLAMVVKGLEDAAPHAATLARETGALEPLREVIGGWTDTLQMRRELRRVRAVAAAAEAIRELGLPIAAVKDRLLLDVLNGAADEDDPELSALWSNLLANTATGTRVAPSFPRVLRELEPIEARLLHAAIELKDQRLPGAELDLDVLDGFDELEWRHLDNLERLALIIYQTSLPMNIERPLNVSRVHFFVNPFGEAFVEACTSPATAPPAAK